MEKVDDLKRIKKGYGERMANISYYLNNNGLLYYLLTSHFEISKSLYEDIINEGIFLFYNIFLHELDLSNL